MTPLGNATDYIYDTKAHTKTTIDPLGLTTVEKYNAHYLLTDKTITSPTKHLLYEEHNTYDKNHNLIEKKTPHNAIKRVYDKRNRVTTLEESPEKITHYSYTPTGQLEKLIKPDGVSIAHTYDMYDRLIRQR